MEAFHVIPIPIPVPWLRAVFVAAGVILFLVAWNTSDRIWDMDYWLDKLPGDDDRRITRFEQGGGLTRGLYLIVAVVLVLLGIFGEKWLKYVAE